MTTNVYECMYILDSNKYARDPGGVSAAIGEMIQKCGGEVLASRLWNEQKLAYPIEGHRKGTYWLAYFRLDTQNLTTFNRQCQLNESIVRHLTLKVEPRLVQALVDHALGIARKPRPEVVIEPDAVAVGAGVAEEVGVDE